MRFNRCKRLLLQGLTVSCKALWHRREAVHNRFNTEPLSRPLAWQLLRSGHWPVFKKQPRCTEL